jgi:Family of unknown function (DUF5662)
MSYDSRSDTLEHIGQVRIQLADVVADLQERMKRHDASKLEPPEKAMYDEFTPKLRDSTYGSDEYKQFLVDMGPALQHHYQHNDHHPEHHAEGIHGMNLVQLIEMLADWKAATLRHADGDLLRSINQNAERFGYGPGLRDLLVRTAEYLGWL